MVRMHLLISLLIGAAMDFCIGDPAWIPHPVRGIGKMTAAFERALRREGDTPGTEFRKGLIAALAVMGISAGTAGAAVRILFGIHPLLGIAGESIICCFCLAARNLMQESERVQKALEQEGIEEARCAVGRIVGRDTGCLSRKGVIRAAVETVAENTSDGVIAPMFWFVLLGPAGMVGYKAVNTMDSMIGYRNERYEYYGKAAAKMDDILNYLPARLTGLLLVASAFLLRMDGRNAWRIFLRDRNASKSPNAGQAESACAGALGLELIGSAVYNGILVEKPTIGDPIREPEPEDIGRANRLMLTASVLALILSSATLLIRFRG